MTPHRTTADPVVLARAQRRARAAAIHRGPSVGLAFDPSTGDYRLAVSHNV